MNEYGITSLNRISEKILRLSQKLLSLPQYEQLFATMDTTFINPEIRLAEMLEPLTRWPVSHIDSAYRAPAIQAATLSHRQYTAGYVNFTETDYISKRRAEKIPTGNFVPVPDNKQTGVVPTTSVQKKKVAGQFGHLEPVGKTLPNLQAPTDLQFQKENDTRTAGFPHNPGEIYSQQHLDPFAAMGEQENLHENLKSPGTEKRNQESTAYHSSTSKQIDTHPAFFKRDDEKGLFKYPLKEGDIVRFERQRTPQNSDAYVNDSSSIPASGVRMINGVSHIAAVLRANVTGSGNFHGISDLQEQPVAKKQLQPESIFHTNSKQHLPRSETYGNFESEFDQLLDKLADRLEFEFMRTYGSSIG